MDPYSWMTPPTTPLPMDAAKRAAWIAALRSGKYTQGSSCLKRQDLVMGVVKYCCLGVWCEERGDTWVQHGSEIFFNEQGNDELLDPEDLFVGVYDFDAANAFITLLSSMNDGYSNGVKNIPHHDFNQIADFIEKHTVGV